MDRIERHRKAGRQMANLRDGVVSPQRLHWRLIPAARGNSGKYRRQHKRPINDKLGPGDPPTYYTYDALNNLIQVQQPGGATDSSQWRTRTFVYDSLSRLISATNPESGIITYTYDANGNLLTKTDARNIITTYTYDALNRLTGKTYSDGEPAVTYTYDQGGAAMNAVGRRTGMADAAGSESWTYDPMGRVLTDQRTTNSVTKIITYTYNLDGTVASIKYPSGLVVNYQVGGAELPTQATDGGTGVNYASSVTYAPQGAVTTLALGGNVNLSESYNSRLQPSAIQATAAGGANLLNLTYDFGLGTADNGDVKAIVDNRDITRTQYFDYDALNRITLANTQASTGANAWGQAFGYDPWGNLTSVTVTQGSAPALNVAVNANNQLAGSPYSYDPAGNMLTDAVNTYTWTAEGKMASVTSSLYGSANYVYDGDGHRVEKSTGKLYWYGTDGNVLAESDLSGNITDEYVFFGGKRIGRVDAQGNVDYYLADSLGSARVVTDANGNILDDCDFLPFGDERCVISTSGNAYKFTGKERDPESQLDHFYARNYSSQYGRFVSPDGSPEPKPAPYADLSDPQTLNLYSYVANNPLRRTDPDGHGMWDDFKKLFKEPFGDNAPTIPQQEAAQQQNSSEGQANQKPSSWDKTKPLPDDPTKLGPDWKKNPDYKNPNGEEYVNDKTGEKMEWNKGRKGPWGPKADRGKDGWHYTPPGGVRGKQMDPGTVLKTAAKVGFWGTAGAITLKIIETAAEACAEGACY